MAIDRSATKTLLGLNGITETSSKEEIKTLLFQAHYSEAEITEYFAPPQAPAAMPRADEVPPAALLFPDYEPLVTEYDVRAATKLHGWSMVLGIIVIVGIAISLYVSGALAYPAKALHLPKLCYLIASKSEQISCVENQ